MLSFFGFVAVADERVGTRPSTVAQNGRGRLTVLLHTTVLIVLNSSVYPHRRPVHPVPALILRPKRKTFEQQTHVCTWNDVGVERRGWCWLTVDTV